MFDIELLHLVIRDLLPLLEGSIYQRGPNRQPGLGSGATHRIEHGVQAAQRLARPIQAKLAKEPMLDGIPFRAPGGYSPSR